MKRKHDANAFTPWVMFFMAPGEEPCVKGSDEQHHLTHKKKYPDTPSVLKAPIRKWRYNEPAYVFVGERSNIGATGMWIVCHWEKVKGGNKWVQGHCKKIGIIQQLYNAAPVDAHYATMSR